MLQIMIQMNKNETPTVKAEWITLRDAIRLLKTL